MEVSMRPLRAFRLVAQVFFGNAAPRAAITPAGRGAKASSRAPDRATPKHVALNWARRLKRVFCIEIEQCARCGGRLEVIASRNPGNDGVSLRHHDP
jgi:hypothetical protein